jgi:hypothetical protein
LCLNHIHIQKKNPLVVEIVLNNAGKTIGGAFEFAIDWLLDIIVPLPDALNG